MKLIGLYISLIFVISCQSYKQKDDARVDTPERGTLHMSADESFKPVLDAQVQVYESQHPEAKIIIHYKPEAEALSDYRYDSIRMIVTTRGFSVAESKYMQDSLTVTPKSRVMAKDAVAVIVHPQAKDSLFSMTEITQILSGTSNLNLIPVFDGVQATSTVRYIVDSILKGKPLTKQAVAAKSSEGVIDYISRTPGAIGLIGVSWIGNNDDSTQLSFLKKVKIAHLESTDAPGMYVLPVQANIYLKRYPMVRDLVYTLKEKHYRGLAYGFARFLDSEVGQLIFKRSYLVPQHRNFMLRAVQVNE